MKNIAELKDKIAIELLPILIEKANFLDVKEVDKIINYCYIVSEKFVMSKSFKDNK
jgi:hypothetical protein